MWAKEIDPCSSGTGRQRRPLEFPEFSKLLVAQNHSRPIPALSLALPTLAPLPCLVSCARPFRPTHLLPPAMRRPLVGCAAARQTPVMDGNDPQVEPRNPMGGGGSTTPLHPFAGGGGLIPQFLGQGFPSAPSMPKELFLAQCCGG